MIHAIHLDLGNLTVYAIFKHPQASATEDSLPSLSLVSPKTLPYDSLMALGLLVDVSSYSRLVTKCAILFNEMYYLQKGAQWLS